MPRQAWLLDVLVEAFRGVKGFQVDFYPGWITRGDTNFDPIGVMDHHTGSGEYNNLLRYMAEGPVHPPLCNYATSRPNDGVVRITVVAAGRANHAGKGGVSWTGIDGGNYRTLGAEHQNDGTQPWPAQQIEAMRRCDAALLKHLGADVGYMLDHKTYAPGRKSDRHTLNVDEERRAVAAIIAGSAPEEDEVLKKGDSGDMVLRWQKNLDFVMPKSIHRHVPDGGFGQKTHDWTIELQRYWGLPQNGTVGVMEWTKMDRHIHEVKQHSLHLKFQPRV